MLFFGVFIGIISYVNAVTQHIISWDFSNGTPNDWIDSKSASGNGIIFIYGSGYFITPYFNTINYASINVTLRSPILGSDPLESNEKCVLAYSVMDDPNNWVIVYEYTYDILNNLFGIYDIDPNKKQIITLPDGCENKNGVRFKWYGDTTDDYDACLLTDEMTIYGNYIVTTEKPTETPTEAPIVTTDEPTLLTNIPTTNTKKPTSESLIPSISPTLAPTIYPTVIPTNIPTVSPLIFTNIPTLYSTAPTMNSNEPTKISMNPSNAPMKTKNPTQTNGNTIYPTKNTNIPSESNTTTLIYTTTANDVSEMPNKQIQRTILFSKDDSIIVLIIIILLSLSILMIIFLCITYIRKVITKKQKDTKILSDSIKKSTEMPQIIKLSDTDIIDSDAEITKGNDVNEHQAQYKFENMKRISYFIDNNMSTIMTEPQIQNKTPKGI